MPTCSIEPVEEPKNTRSPGWRSPAEMWVLMSYWPWAECGRLTPPCAHAHMVSPEQSKPTPGVAPAHTYFTPIWLSAAATAAAAPPPGGGTKTGGGGASDPVPPLTATEGVEFTCAAARAAACARWAAAAAAAACAC